MGVTTGHVVCRVRKALFVYINFYNNNQFKHFSMKKFFLFCMIALVGMCGLNSCSDDCNHDYIEYDYSKALVGTWTCMEPENEFAEALIIKADGSVEVTGLANGELFESKGTIQVKNNKMTYKLDNGDEWEGRFEMVAGESFSMVLDDELDVRYTYHYCENDLADEIIGMWVCHDAPTENEDVMIVQTYKENGKATYTGFGSYVDEFLVNDETNYKVVGDLLFYALPQDELPEGTTPYIIKRLTYKPDGSAYGDIMEEKVERFNNGEEVEITSSMLRIRQSLNLTGKTYDYISAYVSNAKGTDEDFTILGNTFNMSNIKANDIDMMFRSILSCIGLNANSFKYKLRLDGREIEMNDPITVEGNKVTLDMSVSNPACRKVDMYMFQDADDCQLHIYMPTSSFINYFANLQIPTLVQEGKLDTTDAAAVAKVFADMEARIESINVSLVYKARD